MPIKVESTGSHSRKMRFAEIPMLFYLIISESHFGRHKPLLRTFTGTMQLRCCKNPLKLLRNGIFTPLNHFLTVCAVNAQTYWIVTYFYKNNLHRGASSHEMGFCHPCPFIKKLCTKAKIKSDVCVSYSILFYQTANFYQLSDMLKFY